MNKKNIKMRTLYVPCVCGDECTVRVQGDSQKARLLK
jgi:hypothetical protein